MSERADVDDPKWNGGFGSASRPSVAWLHFAGGRVRTAVLPGGAALVSGPFATSLAPESSFDTNASMPNLHPVATGRSHQPLRRFEGALHPLRSM